MDAEFWNQRFGGDAYFYGTAGLEFLVAHEIERDIVEGNGHRGPSAVVQIAARRPL
jgi:hypothetical protein